MFRAFVNGSGSITVECMPEEYQAQPGEILFPDYPTGGQLDARFPDAVLGEARAKARATISMQAEEARLRFVTAGSGKAMAYQEKAREAVAYLADPDPNPANYLLLGAEVGISADAADGIGGVAQVVAQRYQLFRQIEAAIGGMEAAAQKTVKEADDVDTINAAVAGLSWPSPEA